jgi:hypothetical protein
MTRFNGAFTRMPQDPPSEVPAWPGARLFPQETWMQIDVAAQPR